MSVDLRLDLICHRIGVSGVQKVNSQVTIFLCQSFLSNSLLELIMRISSCSLLGIRIYLRINSSINSLEFNYHCKCFSKENH